MVMTSICNNYWIILHIKYCKNAESCEENDYFLVCLVGTLRRSETIFIDVRDLPVLESESSLPIHPGNLKKYFQLKRSVTQVQMLENTWSIALCLRRLEKVLFSHQAMNWEPFQKTVMTFLGNIC